MENSLIESILNVCKTLNKHSVEYLIVGGTAVALHGFYRPTYAPSGRLAEKHDLDFWYNSTYDNCFRLLNALEDFGQDVAGFKAETAPNPKKSFFRMEFDKFTVDFCRSCLVFQNSDLPIMKEIFQKSMKLKCLILIMMI